MESQNLEHGLVRPAVNIGEPLGAGSGTITARDFTASDAQALVDTMIQHYLVSVSDNAPCCCIDGRNCLHSKASATEKPQVGPSLAGGALVTAYAAAELVPDYFALNDPSAIKDRIASVRSILTDSAVEKIVIGAHTADTAAEGTTGCGASDKFTTIMSKPSEQKAVVDGVTSLLLDEESAHDTVMNFTQVEALRARIADYDSLDVVNEVPACNVEILTGNHAEVLVVFNYNIGTTIDRDALVAQTGKQVFVVDMWYIDKLSNAMAAGRPDAADMYDKLRHAMTAFQVSTYLTLCDGTHRPVLLRMQDHDLAS